MITVILIIHLLLAITMVGAILLQRSEGGALGIGGGGGGGMGGFMSGRSTANMLTRATAILATGFFLTSLVLAILTEGNSTTRRSIMDDAAEPASSQTVPAAPAIPSVPLSQ